MKTLLNKRRNKKSKNTNNYMPVGLTNKMKKFIGNTDEHLVDLYQVYLDEKDASDKYRLIFTLNPVCTNALFNAITEVVKDEGSPDCEVLTDTPITPDKVTYPNIISDEKITRIQAIRDTEYSNENIIGYEYLPGIDIFNNHIIRQTGFDCVMPRNERNRGEVEGWESEIDDNYEFIHNKKVEDVFNTIRDYQRTINGIPVKRKFPGADFTYLSPVVGQPHIYEESEIDDFEATFKKYLVEDNGWFGFHNKATLEYSMGTSLTDPSVEIYINRLLNNKGVCDFVDMFPDRKRFTFVPQKNRFRENRLEKNWEYFLTYPYSNTEYILDDKGEVVVEDGKAVLNPIVAEEDSNGAVRNGLAFKVIGEYATDSEKPRILIQSTGSVHNLMGGDIVNLYYLAEDGTYSSAGTFNGVTNISVKGIGDKNGAMMPYYFSIDASSVPGWYTKDSQGRDVLIEGIQGRFAKVILGIECLYYFRVFRRLPNFNEISQDEDRAYYIGKYNKPEKDFNSEINKLAFANNIYGDNIVQIVYLDDIDVNGLTDNYERPVSDIYLTIVKNNKGHKEWYEDKNYGSDKIEISRCFGKVTSGLDLPSDSGFSKNYNVRRLHNIGYEELHDTYAPGEFTDVDENVSITNYEIVNGTTVNNLKPFEDDITPDREFFLGDLVEFSQTQYQEIVLEQVYHRFNTAQRELVSNDFKDIVIDEIYRDDYEGGETANTRGICENFECVREIYNKGYEEDVENNRKKVVTYPGNLFPEGYYYQPHYRIHLKDVSGKISQSSDTQVQYSGMTTGATQVTFTTLEDYDLIVKDGIVIQDPKNNIFYDAVVTDAIGVTGETFIEAEISNGMRLNEGLSQSEQPKSFLVFKKTIGIPKYALHYPDTSGRYIWRPLVAHSKVTTDSEIYDKPFANGAHYRHIGINFFLRRQDPYGEYELNQKTEIETGEKNKLTNFIVPGRYNDGIYNNDAIDFGLIDIC